MFIRKIKEIEVNGVCSDGSHLSVWISFPQFFVMLKNRLCFEEFLLRRLLFQFSYGCLLYLLLFLYTEVKSLEKLVTLFLLRSKTESLAY